MTPDPLDHWGRDRSIDGLRVGALLAVVSGHWLVTAVVVDDYGMSVDSPLRRLPSLAPLTWALQALAPLFCAAGFAAARSLQKRPGWRPWLVTRAGALLAATGTLVAFWSVLLGVLLLGGLPLASLQTIGKLVVSPLWFLAVLAVLSAAWPALDGLDRQLRGYAVLPPAAVVGLDDLARYGGLPIPDPVLSVLAPAALVCAWAVPFLFGIRLARGGGPRRVGGLAMLLTGLGALAALIMVAGYPAGAVGVTGETRSNLGPPSLLVLALAAVQLGLFVLVRPRRAAGPPGRILAVLNAVALPVFLWHQNALLLLVIAAAELLPVEGLVGVPDSPSWVLLRLAWFLVLAVVLYGLVRLMATPLAGEGDSAVRPIRRQG